jgi:hypothetical protein
MVIWRTFEKTRPEFQWYVIQILDTNFVLSHECLEYRHQAITAAWQKLTIVPLTHRIGKDLNVTNTYLALKKRGERPDQLPPNLILRPGFLVRNYPFRRLFFLLISLLSIQSVFLNSEWPQVAWTLNVLDFVLHSVTWLISPVFLMVQDHS